MNTNRIGVLAILALLLSIATVEAQDSLEVEKIGEIIYWDKAMDVVTSGSYAYVADIMGGLRIVNIIDPEEPLPVSYCDTPGEAQGLALSWIYAYVADGDSGLQIINIADPYAPVRTNSYPIAGEAKSVAASGNYAFVAADEAGLRIIDISSTLNPFEISYYDTPGEANHIEISGNYAYIADGDSGLRIIDITNAVEPIEVGHCELPGYANEVDVEGIYVYVADGWGGLRIVNVADPSAPLEVGSYNQGNNKSVAVVDDIAFIGGWDLKSIDISNPVAPVYISQLPTPIYVMDIVICGFYAYLANDYSGLKVIDVTDPTSMSEIGSCGANQFGSDVILVNDYAYVLSSHGLQVVDISQNAHPEIVREFSEFNGYAFVSTWNGYVFVADGSSGIYSLAIYDPLNPVLCDNLDLPGNAYNLAIHYDFAYISTGYDGVRIVDISNPASLLEVGHYDTPGDAGDINVSWYYGTGLHAFVADGDSGLRILDISDPTDPFEVGFWASNEEVRVIDVYGEIAYVGDDDHVLREIDISELNAPFETDSIATESYISKIIRRGDHIYVANNVAGIRIFDSNLNEVAYYNTPGQARDLAIDGYTYMYVADTYTFGVYHWDEPVGIENWQSVSRPAAYILHPPYPNPFNPTTTLTFSLPVASNVRLEVYDINGRNVGFGESDLQGRYSAGIHQVQFDGSELASGIYFVRLQAEEFTKTQKLVLMK